jgi:hypothetical protein
VAEVARGGDLADGEGAQRQSRLVTHVDGDEGCAVGRLCGRGIVGSWGAASKSDWGEWLDRCVNE